jgi:hypothetical protein
MALEGVLEEIRARLEERIRRQLSGLQGYVVGPVPSPRVESCL